MVLIRILAILGLFLLHPLSQAEDLGTSRDALPVELSSSTTHSSEGYLTLRWQPMETQFEPASHSAPLANLQVARERTFASLVRDIQLSVLSVQQQKQVHLSGFNDGTYFARLVDGDQRVLSNAVSFQVQHRDLKTAWGLFGAGLLLFALLLISIINFTRQEHL
ncbi:hypothetical protein [Sedimenticola sp.]|uniref:hypothetical protein n=1 Tax=Sedimenticola sp. TaxID=1940285 RepID=UPI003D14DA63